MQDPVLINWILTLPFTPLKEPGTEYCLSHLKPADT